MSLNVDVGSSNLTILEEMVKVLGDTIRQECARMEYHGNRPLCPRETPFPDGLNH